MVLIDRRACKEDQKGKEKERRHLWTFDAAAAPLAKNEKKKKKDIYGLLMLLLRHCNTFGE